MKNKACELVLTRDLAYYPCMGAVFFRGELLVCSGMPVYTHFLGKLKHGPDLPIPLDVLKQWAEIQSWAAEKSTK